MTNQAENMWWEILKITRREIQKDDLISKGYYLNLLGNVSILVLEKKRLLN